MADRERFELTVNGASVSLAAAPQTSLLAVLRTDLALSGARSGCGVGECGACTVLVDGRAVRACDTLAADVAGGRVVTPEGLGTPEAPGALQQAFLDRQAGQCGYCVNGMIMAVAALADAGEADAGALDSALSEHVCRCGVHARVREAACAALGLADPRPRTVHTVDAADGRGEPWQPPASLESAPDIADWLALRDDGRVEVRTGKVEIGQGIRTAMARIAAAQLGIDVDRVVVAPATTGAAPDEGYTAGSNSVDTGGAAIAAAAVACREALLARAGVTLEADPATLRIDGAAVVRDDGHAASLADLAARGPLTGPIDPVRHAPDWTRVTGRELTRDDLRAKLTGAPAYVHDLTLPGMRCARALLPPTYDAVLTGIDTDTARALPGVVDVVVDARVVVAIAERDDQAARAVARLAESATWDDPGVDWPGTPGPPESFRDLDGRRRVHVEPDGPPQRAADVTVAATYGQPYQAHAPVTPSCAVAQWHDDGVAVWSHTQGVHPLRRELAALLELDVGAVEVTHADGPGCYGHNLADDAAGFAVIAARAAGGAPVRFVFSVDDEFAWEPYGTAMLVDVDASLDADRRLRHWTQRVRTDAHPTRPHGSGRGLLVGWLGAGGVARDWDGPDPGRGGERNAVPPYAVEAVEATVDRVRGPLRTSSLRTLGSYANVFAGESTVDELAYAAGHDPLALRLANLDDARLAHVLTLAADAIGYEAHTAPSGRGVGLAAARYHHVKAMVAQAAHVEVDPDSGGITVHRVVTACDAGTVVDRDGLANQLEGGTMHGLSRTLVEQVRADRAGVTSRDWTSYPVLRQRDVPAVETIVVDRPGDPPLGAGEASMPPIAAAVANAVDDAVGVRLRDLPLTPAAFRRRLLELDDAEAARVRIE